MTASAIIAASAVVVFLGLWLVRWLIDELQDRSDRDHFKAILTTLIELRDQGAVANANLEQIHEDLTELAGYEKPRPAAGALYSPPTMAERRYVPLQDPPTNPEPQS